MVAPTPKGGSREPSLRYARLSADVSGQDWGSHAMSSLWAAEPARHQCVRAVRPPGPVAAPRRSPLPARPAWQRRSAAAVPVHAAASRAARRQGRRREADRQEDRRQADRQEGHRQLANRRLASSTRRPIPSDRRGRRSHLRRPVGHPPPGRPPPWAARGTNTPPSSPLGRQRRDPPAVATRRVRPHLIRTGRRTRAGRQQPGPAGQRPPPRVRRPPRTGPPSCCRRCSDSPPCCRWHTPCGRSPPDAASSRTSPTVSR